MTEHPDDYVCSVKWCQECAPRRAAVRACDNFLHTVVAGVKGVFAGVDEMMAEPSPFKSWVDATREDE